MSVYVDGAGNPVEEGDHAWAWVNAYTARPQSAVMVDLFETDAYFEARDLPWEV